MAVFFTSQPNFSHQKAHLFHTSAVTHTLIIVSITLRSPTHSPGVSSIVISVREMRGCVLSSGHSIHSVSSLYWLLLYYAQLVFPVR